jgi:hypothetical protein
MRRYTLAIDDDLAGEVEQLAVEYGLTEREVLTQLVECGLETLD